MNVLFANLSYADMNFKGILPFMRASLLAENYRGATACNYRVIDKITRESWQSNTGRPLF